MKASIEPGRVVFSKKGRDKNRYFVVLYALDADFVMIADGDTRKLDKMKKKRVKHLTACPYEAPQLAERYQAGVLQDAEIRKFLLSTENCADAQTV